MCYDDLQMCYDDLQICSDDLQMCSDDLQMYSPNEQMCLSVEWIIDAAGQMFSFDFCSNKFCFFIMSCLRHF